MSQEKSILWSISMQYLSSALHMTVQMTHVPLDFPVS